MTTQTELRTALDDIKTEEGTGSKQRKQDRFKEIYTSWVGYLVAGEKYDDAGVGPSTARESVEATFDGLDTSEYPTISEALNSSNVVTSDAHDTCNSCKELVHNLNGLADRSGNEQKERLKELLQKHREPSLVTLALLDDESFGLGTSQMREIWFDGSRDERKRAEALTEDTVDFIIRAKNGTLPEGPELFSPFDPMLAKSESAGRPDNPVAQPKLDGYRILIHVDSGSARAYTRNREDETHSLPELQDIDWPEGDYILDGEVIAADRTYSTTSSRIGKKAENIDPNTTMNFALFDIIRANGEDLTRRPFKERHQKLKKFTDQAVDDGKVYTPPVSSNIDEMKRYAVKQDHEGVIIKDLHGEYKLGKRSGLWVKEKHEREHVDVRVSDVVEGEGRMHGKLGKFIIESKEGKPLGGCGTGFSDELAARVWWNQDEWIGGTIEVSAEAYDPSGDGGLRFPVFERDRRADGEPDSVEKIKDLLSAA